MQFEPEIPDPVRSILTLNCNSSFSLGKHHLHLHGSDPKDLNVTIKLLRQYPHYVNQTCCRHSWLLVGAEDCQLQCGNHPKWFRKHCSQPYLNQLLGGEKTVEGRLRTGDWSRLRIGDVIEFYDGDLSEVFQVKNLHPVESFGALFRLFEEKLLPGVHQPAEAEQIYAGWFSAEQVQKHGVIGVEVVRISGK